MRLSNLQLRKFCITRKPSKKIRVEYGRLGHFFVPALLLTVVVRPKGPAEVPFKGTVPAGLRKDMWD